MSDEEKALLERLSGKSAMPPQGHPNASEMIEQPDGTFRRRTPEEKAAAEKEKTKGPSNKGMLEQEQAAKAAKEAMVAKQVAMMQYMVSQQKLIAKEVQ